MVEWNKLERFSMEIFFRATLTLMSKAKGLYYKYISDS